MTELVTVQKIDDSLIDEIIKRIVESAQPEKIILFGSRVYGRAREGSDIDILVIVKTDVPRYKRAVPIYKALAGLLIGKDVLVYTPKEIEDWSEVPQAFITEVMEKGRIIYEKNQS